MRFSKPASASGLDLKALNGALLLIYPLRVETGIHTNLGDRDATIADVHVVDGEQAGRVPGPSNTSTARPSRSWRPSWPAGRAIRRC